MTATSPRKKRSLATWGTVKPMASGRFQARLPASAGQATLGTFASEKLARAALAKAQTEMDSGKFVVASKVLFRDYAENWLIARKRSDGARLARTTQDLYRHQLDKYLLPAFGAVPLKDITATMVNRLYASMAETPSGQAHVYRLLKSILATAETDDLIGRNPCRIKGGGIEPPSRRGNPEDEQARAIIEQVTKIDSRWRLLPVLAFRCGLRAGELAGLRVSDIDTELRVLHVRRTVVRVKGGLVTKGPKSASGVRDIPLDDDVLKEVIEHLNIYVPNPATKADGPLTETAVDPPVFSHSAWRGIKTVTGWRPVTRARTAELAADLRERAKLKATGRPMSATKRAALIAEAEQLEAVKVYADVPKRHQETGLMDLSRFHRDIWGPALAAAGVVRAEVHLHDGRAYDSTRHAHAGASLKELMDRLGDSSPDAALRYQRPADITRHREISARRAAQTKKIF